MHEYTKIFLHYLVIKNLFVILKIILITKNLNQKLRKKIINDFKEKLCKSQLADIKTVNIDLLKKNY